MVSGLEALEGIDDLVLVRMVSPTVPYLYQENL
jgi:hypothetical protein